MIEVHSSFLEELYDYFAEKDPPNSDEAIFLEQIGTYQDNQIKTNNMTNQNKDIISVLESEIEQYEVLLDDLANFSKGCTDPEQEIIDKTLIILQNRVRLISDKIVGFSDGEEKK